MIRMSRNNYNFDDERLHYEANEYQRYINNHYRGIGTTFSLSRASREYAIKWFDSNCLANSITADNGERRNPDVWVTKEKKAIPISELDDNHLKNIIACFNMGDNLYGQAHKKDAILAEYEKRKG